MAFTRNMVNFFGGYVTFIYTLDGSRSVGGKIGDLATRFEIWTGASRRVTLLGEVTKDKVI